MRHIHWVIQAYDEKTEDGNMTWVMSLDLLAETRDIALAKARSLCPHKKGFRVQQVIEHDPDLEQAGKVTSTVASTNGSAGHHHEEGSS